MHGDDESNVPVPRSRESLRPGRVQATTARWHIGRLVHLSVEASCGFIRSPSGELLYFAMKDVAHGQGGGLRAGARVRFQQEGAGIPRAVQVHRL